MVGSSSMIWGTSSTPLIPGMFTSSSMPVIRLPLENRQGLLAGGRGGDFVSLLGQELAERIADRFLVVHDEQGDGPIGQGHTNSSSRC